MNLLKKIKNWFEGCRLKQVIKEHKTAFGKLSSEDKEKFVNKGMEKINQCKCNCKKKK